MILRSSLSSIVLSTSLLSSAHAGDWSYRVTPYLWLPGVETSLDVGSNPPVEGSTSILDILDGAFLISGEARSENWSILGEFNYLNLSDDFGVSSNDPVAGWDLRGTMVSLAAARRIADSSNFRLEALAGFRRWDVTAETFVLGKTASTDKEWIDPIIGARITVPISERASLNGMANVGGFGVGSDRQWEVIAQAEFQTTKNLSLSAGYRILEVSFKDSVLQDLHLSGPFLAVNISF